MIWYHSPCSTKVHRGNSTNRAPVGRKQITTVFSCIQNDFYLNLIHKNTNFAVVIFN